MIKKVGHLELLEDNPEAGGYNLSRRSATQQPPQTTGLWVCYWPRPRPQYLKSRAPTSKPLPYYPRWDHFAPNENNKTMHGHKSDKIYFTLWNSLKLNWKTQEGWLTTVLVTNASSWNNGCHLPRVSHKPCRPNCYKMIILSIQLVQALIAKFKNKIISIFETR